MVRRTGNGEWRRNVRRTCDCKAGGNDAKWLKREGRVIKVVKATSGWIGAWGWGDEGPLGGADGQMLCGGGDAVGDGRGDGGAALATALI